MKIGEDRDSRFFQRCTADNSDRAGFSSRKQPEQVLRISFIYNYTSISYPKWDDDNYINRASCFGLGEFSEAKRGEGMVRRKNDFCWNVGSFGYRHIPQN